MADIKNLGISLQSQIDQLKKSKTTLEDNISRLKQKDTQILSELANVNKSMAVKDALVRNFLRIVTDKEKREFLMKRVLVQVQLQKSLESQPSLQSSKAQQLLDSYNTLSHANQERMHKLNEAIQHTPVVHKSIAEIKQEVTRENTSAAAAAAASMNAGSLIGSPLKTADGLTFVTLGRLSSNMSVRDNKPAIEIMAADQTSNLAAALQPTNTLKRKSSPTATQSSSSVSWTVPPRILLVDDDSVYRDLSGKLLSVIGCTIDLAKDGVEALKKMGEEKYDLILMVSWEGGGNHLHVIDIEIGYCHA